MRSLRLITLFALGSSVFAADGPPPKVIALQPFEVVDRLIIDSVTKRIQGTFVCTIKVLPLRELPKKALYSKRNRYRGTLLLDDLATATSSVFSNVLGVTTKDISVTKGSIYDWGVFGVAYLSQRPAVISTFRLRGIRASRELLLARTEKVAIHEVGHTFGLNHCPNPKCVMADACGTIKTVDSSTGQFCSDCSKQLGNALRAGP